MEMDRNREDSHRSGTRADASGRQTATGRVVEGLRQMATEAPVTFRVSGQCMEPVIPAEAEIVVSARRRYWPGDIIAFRSALGELRVHRLIGFHRQRGRTLLQMRADATGTLDQLVGSEQIIGKVIGNPRPLTVSLSSRIAAVARFARIQMGRALRA